MQAFGASASLEGGASADSAVEFDDYDPTTALTLTAPAGADAAYFNSAEKILGTLVVNGDVDYYINGGFYAELSSSGEVLRVNSSENINSKVVFDNGTYEFGSADANIGEAIFKINAFLGTAESPQPQKAIVFESGSVVNINAATATFQGPYYGPRVSLPAYVVKGTMNVNNGDARGDLFIDWNFLTVDGVTRGGRVGMEVRDGGVVNVANVKIENYSKLSVLNGGTLNADGTLTLYGNNVDAAPMFLVDEGGVANVQNLVHRVGFQGSTQNGVATSVHGTLNVAGKLSFDVQDAAAVAKSDNLLRVYGEANIGEADLTTIGKITALDGGVVNAGKINLSGSGYLYMSKGTVNVKNLTVTGGTLDMSSSSILNISGDSSLSGTFTTNIQTAQINVTGGTLTYDTSASLNLANPNSLFTIQNGASIYANGDFNLTGGGKMVFEKGSAFSANTFTVSGGSIEIDGDLTLRKTDASNFMAMTINSGRKVVVGENGSVAMTANGRISLSGTLEINGSVTSKQIVFWSRANSLILNSENALKLEDGTGITLNFATGTYSTITVRDTNVFAGSIMQGDSGTNKFGVVLNLDFSSADDYISLGEVTHYENIIRIYVANFEDNRIMFNSVIKDGFLELYDINGNEIAYQFDTAEGGGYWLNNLSVAVPEPAEWAMILGSLALGFAIYRRRK